MVKPGNSYNSLNITLFLPLRSIGNLEICATFTNEVLEFIKVLGFVKEKTNIKNINNLKRPNKPFKQNSFKDKSQSFGELSTNVAQSLQRTLMVFLYSQLTGISGIELNNGIARVTYSNVSFDNTFDKTDKTMDKLRLARTFSTVASRVYDCVLSIPCGTIFSYSQVASLCGTSPRAVGTILRLNPYPILIPCHRVIGKDGALKGYGGEQSVTLKEKILNFEKFASSDKV